MKGMQLCRLLAVASFLCTRGCLVQGKDKTETLTTARTQTITQQNSNTLTVTSAVTSAVTLAVTQTVTQQTSNTLTVTKAVTQTVVQQTSAGTRSIAQAPQPVSTQPPLPIAPLPTSAPSSVTGGQGEVFVTIAVQQAALFGLANALGDKGSQGVITLQPNNAVAIPQATGDSGGNIPRPTGIAQSSTEDPLQSLPSTDAALGAFPGGNPPNTTVDLPLTIFFLLLFIGGAVTHISIYRANAKRGHKFLLSDLMFDFCMVRTVTCIFRIIWVFTQVRGVVLAAQVFFNGGASVIFAVNIFLVQRIVRSMHPKIGWSRPFSIVTRAMAISVPAIIVSQIISIIVLFFSVNDADRFNSVDKLLKVGGSYLLILATFPFWTIFLACSVPGPKPEKFGVGNLRVKTSLVMLASAMLTTGAIVRTHAFFVPQPADTNDVLYGRPIFYTTQFMLEIIVVAAYAVFRFDLLFHIPNGSSKPGDYSMNTSADIERSQLITRESIENLIAAWNVPHQILSPSSTRGLGNSRADEPVYAVFFPGQLKTSTAADSQEMEYEAKLPPRPPRRVSRRDTIIEYVQQQQQPLPTWSRSTYNGLDDGNVPPLRRPSGVGPRTVAPQFWFDKPRKPPTPPK